jgi:hypothetical protein
MSFAGKLARGLLAGGAGYYGKVAEEQAETRKSDALLMREKALAQFNSDLTNERTTHTGNVDAALDTVKTNNKVRGEKDILPAKTAAQIEVDSAKEETDFRIWKKKQPIELQNDLTLEDYRNDRQDSRAVASDSRRVVAEGVNGDGDVVITYSDGRVTTMKGMKPKPGGGKSGATNILDLDEGGGGGTVTAPAKAAGPDYSQYRQLMAEARMDPRYKEMAGPDLRREIRSLAARNNIPVPPGE